MVKLLIRNLSIICVGLSLCFSAHASWTVQDRTDLLEIVDGIRNGNLDKSRMKVELLSDYYDSKEIGPIILGLLEEEISDKNRKRKVIIEVLLENLGASAQRSLVLGKKGENSSPFLEFQERFNVHLQSEDKYKRAPGKEEFKKILFQINQEIKKRGNAPKPSIFGADFSFEQMLEQIEELKKVQFDAERAQEQEKIDADKLSRYDFFQAALEKDLGPNYKMKEIKVGEATATELVLFGTTSFITDKIAHDIIDGKVFKMIGRETVVENLLNVLGQTKQQNAALLGSKGSGKTSIMDALAYEILKGDFHSKDVFSFLKNAVIVQTSSSDISSFAKSNLDNSQAAAIGAYFRALKEVQEKFGRRIIVFFDEMHTLSPDQINAAKPYIESTTSQILFVGASTPREFRNTFKKDDAFLRRIAQIAVHDLSPAEILTIFKESWMGILAASHPGLTISDPVKIEIIKKAKLVYPEKGPLDGAFVLADHLAVRTRSKYPNRKPSITLAKLNEYILSVTGLPVDTKNRNLMENYRVDLLGNIRKNVLGQEKMTNDLVDLWMSVLRNESSRGVRVGMVMGRSGTGKTEAAKQLARYALGSSQHVFSIKANDFKDANDIKMSVLFGVPGGVNFGRETSGTLMDWLDEPAGGKYKGIIVIDEADKANELFWQKFMEIFEEGVSVGGDGKTRSLNRHLIVLTSNLRDKEMFPMEAVDWSEEKIQETLDAWDEDRLRDLFEEELPDSIVNRVDVVTASSLITRSIGRQIVDLQLARIAARYKDELGLNLSFSEDVTEVFIKNYDPSKRGARYVVRAIGFHLENNVEKALGQLDYKKGDKLEFSILKEDGREKVHVKHKAESLDFTLPRASQKSCSGSF